MSRIFRQHTVRRVVPLDGLWSLHLPVDGTQIDPTEACEAPCRPLDVPGVWEQLVGIENYRGQAVVRRTFRTDADAAARLVFKGVSHTARVLLDGEELGRHHNAYTPFAIDVPRLPAGEHELRVHVSNEHGEISALHVPNDYYDYGGINRPVELHVLGGQAYVRYVHFTPRRSENGWAANLRASVVNLAEPADATLTVRVAGQAVELSGRLEAGATELSGEMGFDDVECWSPEAPNLYDLAAELAVNGETVDDWRDRVGFRTVEVRGRDLLLNGEPVFLFGFNRHEDHAEYGSALPTAAIRRDVEIMRDLGANAVRTSHYPNDERFLDLCDEYGLVVWEENHARGLNLRQMQHPLFERQCADCIDEMIAWHYNHPSIVLWGILNECASETPEGREMYARQFEQIRSLDSSRPTTFASCRHGSDICQDLPDVAGWNWYFNWYGQEDVADGLAAQLEWLATSPAADKPIIVSEFGGGALPGYRDPRRRAKWSEERQADILDECLSAYLTCERLSGAFIWQFCDVRVDEAVATGRPRTMNNKGVVDEHRREKLAADVVRRHFAEMRRRRGAADG